MPNGCGMFGTISKVWKLATGEFPPFEACCNEHDLAYEQGVSGAERAWADVHFQRCMTARGFPTLGNVFFFAVRYFGWIAALRRRLFPPTNP